VPDLGRGPPAAPRHVDNPAARDDEDEFDDAPADEVPFRINDLGPVQDGDWPPMVTARAFDLLPSDLQARFGTDTSTTLNGDYLEIPLECEAELVTELQARQFDVTRNDQLINILDGRSFNPIR
jgi:hypothetical protein